MEYRALAFEDAEPLDSRRDWPRWPWQLLGIVAVIDAAWIAITPISLSDASDPSPARIAEIQARVAELDVTCVLSEPQYSPGVVAAVMEGSDTQTGVLDPLGSDLAPGPALYPQVLRNLASALADCLRAPQ